MFLVVTVAATKAQTGKVSCNLQDTKNPAAKTPATSENLDWILHGTPVPGIAFYNNRLQPGAAEYSANAAIASSVSMQSLCLVLNAINEFTKGGLKKSATGEVVEITPELVRKYEPWLRANTQSMKIDFGTKPIAMIAANLPSRSLDTVIHAGGLGIQSTTVLKTKEGLFPVFLDLCANGGNADFVFALVNKTARIVDGSTPSATDPGQTPPAQPGTPATAGIDPQVLKLIEANNKSILDALKANESTKGSPIFINSPVMYTGGNTLSGGTGQNGRDGRDGASASTTTTTTGGTSPGFQTPAPGTVVQPVTSGQWVQAGTQGTPQSAGIACANCLGAQGSNAWNRQDVAYLEQQEALNNKYNADMLRQMKTANVINGINMGLGFVNTGTNLANTIDHWDDHGSTVNVYGTGVKTPPTVPGGPANWPNGTGATTATTTEGPSDNPNGF